MRSVGIIGVAAVGVAALAAVVWAGTTHPFADRSSGWWCNAHRTDILVSGSTPLGWTEPHWGSVRGDGWDDAPCSQADLASWCRENAGARYCT